jgi:hypothetical protein
MNPESTHPAILGLLAVAGLCFGCGVMAIIAICWSNIS